MLLSVSGDVCEFYVLPLAGSSNSEVFSLSIGSSSFRNLRVECQPRAALQDALKTGERVQAYVWTHPDKTQELIAVADSKGLRSRPPVIGATTALLALLGIVLLPVFGFGIPLLMRVRSRVGINRALKAVRTSYSKPMPI